VDESVEVSGREIRPGPILHPDSIRSVRTIFAHFTPRQRLALAAIVVAGLGLLTVWLAQSRSANHQVSVTFTGCTNVDAFGISQPFTLAHFQLTNQGSATLACGLGMVEFKIGEIWVPDTNRQASQYGPILRPRAMLSRAVALPPETTHLRASFLLTPTPSHGQIMFRLNLETTLQRFGVRWRPKSPSPIILPIEVVVE